MSYIGILNGTYFDFDDMDKNVIDISTVAIVLSRTPRFTGHTEPMYSVAQHSLLVESLIAESCPELRLAALMHDAHECVIGDLSTPLKTYLKQSQAFVDMENRVKAFFAIDFGFSIEYAHGPVVKEADLLALWIERQAFMPLFANDVWKEDPADEVKNSPFVQEKLRELAAFVPHYAAKKFVNRFETLIQDCYYKRLRECV